MPKGRAQGTPKVLSFFFKFRNSVVIVRPAGKLCCAGDPANDSAPGGRYESSGRSAREDDDENDDLGRWWSRCMGDERQENNT